MSRLPNIVLIVTDDQGYADVGCFGGKGIKTPNLDKMAADGMQMTDFYSAAPICSSSRAAILTGCYPQRVGDPAVLFPRSPKHPEWGGTGLHPDEETIANVLKRKDYSTICIGKWHLGDEPPFLPLYHGFDQYFGIPYSNDMCAQGGKDSWYAEQGYPPLPYFEGNEMAEVCSDMSQITTRYTERALSFIEENKDKPFFLYLAHNMPHVPLAVSDKFKGTSQRGLYGDVIQEIDWSVGQVLDKIRSLGLEKDTIAVFLSDNGPWLTYNEEGGCALPLRDGKFSVYDGGMRVPCIVWGPGHIQSGRICSELMSTIDLMPTFASFAGNAKLPGRKIDGIDVSTLLTGETDQSPREIFFFGDKGVRKGKYKYFTDGTVSETVFDETTRKYTHMIEVSYPEPRLYNLREDISETKDICASAGVDTESMKALLKEHLAELSANARPLGRAKDKE